MPGHRGRKTSLGQERWAGEITSRPRQHLRRQAHPILVQKGSIGRGMGEVEGKGKPVCGVRPKKSDLITVGRLRGSSDRHHDRCSNALCRLPRIPRPARPTEPQTTQGGHHMRIRLKHPRRILDRSCLRAVWRNTGIRNQYRCDIVENPPSVHKTHTWLQFRDIRVIWSLVSAAVCPSW